MRQLGVITLFAAIAFSALGVGEAAAQSTNPPDMIYVKGGTFKMGSNDGYADEKPVHTVTVSDFYIGKYEVTVAQYRQFCTETGHRFHTLLSMLHITTPLHIANGFPNILARPTPCLLRHSGNTPPKVVKNPKITNTLVPTTSTKWLGTTRLPASVALGLSVN